MNFRKFIFNYFDYFKGSKIKNHLLDIDNILLNQENLENKKIIQNRLENICNYAIENVSFYKNISNKNIESFPVMNKIKYRESIDDFLSKEFDKNNLVKVTTSGSTGTPFSIYHNIAKRIRNSADTIYFANMGGYEIGMPLYYLKVWNKINQKSFISRWFENIYPINVTQISDKECHEFILNLKDSKSKALIGYPSAFEAIYNYYNSNFSNETLKGIKSVITMSESLSDEFKKKLHSMFGISPCSRYSNVENGILAQQPINGELFFIVNKASYYIEILDEESNTPLPYGKLGRIVVTDFFNLAMPMIRYDTGDLGILDFNSKINKEVLLRVEGRRMDMVFDTEGKLVSSFTITNNMWLYPEIKQYQFIQKSKNEYEFVLNLDGQFKRENELITEFKKYFGLDANIAVSYVDEIPLLKSGKRKKVINLNK